MHYYSADDLYDLLQCEACDTPHAPSCYAPCLMEAPSGLDLIGNFVCHTCGQEAVVAFNGEVFLAAYHAEAVARLQAQHEQEKMTEHKTKSEIGRKVASFREELARIDTVEEMWAT